MGSEISPVSSETPTLDPVLNHLILGRILKTCYSKIRFIIIFPYISRRAVCGFTSRRLYESKMLQAFTQVLIIVYNATIYASFSNTIAFDSLKLFKIF
jgi:hypothetical protein